MMSVILSREECEEATIVAFGRNASARRDRRETVAGADESVWWDYLGALGEKAFSVWSGIPWDHSIGRLGRHDVGGYQLRTTDRFGGRVMVRLKDRAEDVFVFAEIAGTVEDGIEVYLIGWNVAGRLKRPDWLRTYRKNGECFAVPRSALQDMFALSVERGMRCLSSSQERSSSSRRESSLSRSSRDTSGRRASSSTAARFTSASTVKA